MPECRQYNKKVKQTDSFARKYSNIFLKIFCKRVLFFIADLQIVCYNNIVQTVSVAVTVFLMARKTSAYLLMLFYNEPFRRLISI